MVRLDRALQPAGLASEHKQVLQLAVVVIHLDPLGPAAGEEVNHLHAAGFGPPFGAAVGDRHGIALVDRLHLPLGREHQRSVAPPAFPRLRHPVVVDDFLVEFVAGEKRARQAVLHLPIFLDPAGRERIRCLEIGVAFGNLAAVPVLVGEQIGGRSGGWGGLARQGEGGQGEG